MKRQLFIVRHALTHSGHHYITDKERELKHEGVAQATALGTHLAASDYKIDLIISSDAERAKSTAELIASTTHYPSDRILYKQKLYSGTLTDLIHVVREIPNTAQQVLMVGHYPTILELHNHLMNEEKPGMATCELSLAEIEVEWANIQLGSGTSILNFQSTF